MFSYKFELLVGFTFKTRSLGQFVLNDTNEARLSLMFSLSQNGMTHVQIAHYLNEIGCKPVNAERFNKGLVNMTLFKYRKRLSVESAPVDPTDITFYLRLFT